MSSSSSFADDVMLLLKLIANINSELGELFGRDQLFLIHFLDRLNHVWKLAPDILSSGHGRWLRSWAILLVSIISFLRLESFSCEVTIVIDLHIARSS